MEEQDDNRDRPTSLEDTTNESKAKVWKRRMAIVIFVAALIGFLICPVLLAQAYVSHQPPPKLLWWEFDYSSYQLGFELLGYSSSVLGIEGFLAFIISTNISLLFSRKRNILGYILASIGTILLFFALGLSPISINLEQAQGRWEYFSRVNLGTGGISLTFSKLVSTKRKRLGDILEITGSVLIFIGLFRLIFFEAA